MYSMLVNLSWQINDNVRLYFLLFTISSFFSLVQLSTEPQTQSNEIHSIPASMKNRQLNSTLRSWCIEISSSNSQKHLWMEFLNNLILMNPPK